MEVLNDWDYALDNMRKARKQRINKLIRKYGFPINEKDLLKEDYAEYDLLKSELKEIETERLANTPIPQGTSLDDVDMEKNAAIVKAHKEKQNTTPIRQNSLIDKTAEIIATSDFARKTALALQGVADSYMNPAGLALRTKNYIETGEFSTGLDRIEPQDEVERLIENIGELSYEIGTLGKAGKTALTQYDKKQFSKAYKKVYEELIQKNPGQAEDIMATSHRLFGSNTHIQRGAAAYTEDGKLITQGKKLQRATQGNTKSNYGLTKEIGLHNMSKKDVELLPEILDKYTPTETTTSGRQIYEIAEKNGKTRHIVTALKKINGKFKRVIISDYWLDEPKTPIRELLK